jgi:hypothetical protein
MNNDSPACRWSASLSGVDECDCTASVRDDAVDALKNVDKANRE